MWLATHAPARVDRLVLANTAAQIAPPELWNARIDTVGKGGMAAIADAVLARWFTAPFVAAGRRRAATRCGRCCSRARAQGYVACCAAVRDMDQRAAVARIAAPTLVIAGTGTSPRRPRTGRFLADAIPGARYVELPPRTSPTSKQPRAFTDLRCCASLPESEAAMDENERHTKGMKVRRAVLGDAHVDRALAQRNDVQRASSRTSSPATRGARSGPGPGCRGTRAA